SQVSGGLRFTEFLARIKETTLEAYSHQDTPFEKVVERLLVGRDAGRASLFQAMFDLKHGGETLMPVNNESLSSHASTSKFDLSINVNEYQDGLRISVEYCTDLFLPSTIRRLQGHFLNLLSGAVKNRHSEIRELALLTREEEDRLLYHLNHT